MSFRLTVGLALFFFWSTFCDTSEYFGDEPHGRVVSDHEDQRSPNRNRRTLIDDRCINRTTSSQEIDALRFPGMTDSKSVNSVLTDRRRTLLMP
jgi:hypothetical protein